MIGPVKEITDLNYKLKGKPTTLGDFVVDCAEVPTLPTVDIYIEKRKFSLKSEDYVLVHGKTCTLGFIGTDAPDAVWRFGDIFIGSYYTVFDVENKRVGFAVAKK